MPTHENRIIFAAVIMVLSLAVLAGDGFGAEAPKDMTREEIIADLKKAALDDEFFELFPDMKSEKGADGNAYLAFRGLKIEDMPKEDIDNLLTEVRWASVRILARRIERQMETVRRAGKLKGTVIPPQLMSVPAVPPPSGTRSLPAPQAAANKAEAPKARVSKKDMTREEMVLELKEELKYNEELFDLFPDMKSKKGDDGNVYFTFKGVKIEDMPKEDIDNLLTKVRQALTKIKTDRIERQLEIVRRVERLNRAAAPLQSPRAPAAPPSAPSVPSAPPSPQSAPRAASAPPSPPRR